MESRKDQVKQIIFALAKRQQRATYGAIAKHVGLLPVAVMSGQPRTHLNSWVVSAKDHRPTGYSPEECDPKLDVNKRVIESGEELANWLKNHG